MSLLRSLIIDSILSGTDPTPELAFTYSEKSPKVSAIPGVSITRSGHIERRDQKVIDKVSF